MNANLQQPKFNYQLEALRGFAAIAVVIYHITNTKELFDADYYSSKFAAFAPPGHLCVLVFFMLSGYVIGISNPGRLHLNQIIPYIKKRLVRIYPIYFVCIVFTLLIASHSYPFTVMLSNLLFTQDLFTVYLAENSPAWSLNYEIVYYSMFIPLSYFKINPVALIIIVVTLGVVNFYLYPSFNAPIISSYFWGFSFWLFGLCIAWYFKNKEIKTRASLLLSNLFLLLTIGVYDTTNHILKYITLHIFKTNLTFPENVLWAKIAITFVDLSVIPYCLISVLLFSSIQFKFKRVILVAFQILPIFSLLYLIPYFKHSDHTIIIASGIYYLISTLLFISRSDIIDRFCGFIIKKLVWLGSISYGIYIIHYPLLIIIGRLQSFHNLLLTYVLRIALLLVATIAIAYLLEKIFQPWIKNLIVTRPLKKTAEV